METSEKDRPAGLISEDEHLRLFLWERNVACPLCGYNLRCQTAARCPECGRELKLTVGLTEPYLRAWISLAAVTFGTGGIGALAWLATCFDGPPRHMPPLVAFSFIFFLSGPVQAALAILKRRAFIRLQTGAQWRIVLIASALTVGAIVALFVSH